MQVNVNKVEQPAFIPVVLSITIESAEEGKMLRDMFGWNVSIPAIVYENNETKREALLELMGKIHDVIRCL